MILKETQTTYVDDSYESISTLMKLRAPSLCIWLILGIIISFITSRFEEVLSSNIQVAYFMPFIVYIADAIGTQTESIYSRNLKNKKTKFITYLHKESLIWLLFGIVFWSVAWLIALIWFHNTLLALSVGIATCIAVALSPLLALTITHISATIHQDPAASSWPITTVIQDLMSIVIYGLVASRILL